MTEDLSIARQWLTKAMNDLLNADNNLESETIPYAVEIRYPDDLYLPSEGDAMEARAAAGDVLEWLKNASADIFADTG